jgi:hypothetical protein
MVALVSIVTAARSETARDALEQFGFFGTWAVHCEEPASPENVTRHALASTKTRLSFTETLGNDSQPNIYSILSAKRLNADTVVIRTKLNNDIEQDLTIRREQNRVRTMQNREVESGDFVVKDGVVDSNKSETPWLTRCSDEPRSQ